MRATSTTRPGEGRKAPGTPSESEGRVRLLGLIAALAVVAVVLFNVVWARLRPADPLTRAWASYERKDWRRASTLALERLDQDATDREALRLLARASARLGRDDTAQDLFYRLGAQGAGAEDFYLLATTLLRQRDDSQAMRMLERAQDADPNHAETLQALAEIYSTHDFRLTATQVARRLARLPGWEARGHWALGRMLDGLLEPADAAASFAQVLRYDPEARSIATSPAAVRKRLARALLRLERPAESRDQLQTTLKAGPDREAFWLLSRALLQQGALADASAALERAGDYADANVLAPEPAPYVGAARCASCHAEIHQTEQASRHARTFARGTELGQFSLPEGPIADPHNPRVTHTLTRAGGRIRVETRVEDKLLTAMVEYALGSGGRAVTWVVRDDAGEFREYRLSRYAETVGWDQTVHHPDIPTTASGYLGKPISADRVPICIHCHVTNFRAARDVTGPESADHGIGCERCHGPGGNHLKAVAVDFPDMAIAQPQLATAAERTALCVQCHDGTPGATPADPEYVRFQGPNLLKSRCYTESGGNLDCMTCHNPHRSVETSAKHYEAKCLECHGQPADQPKLVKTSSRAQKPERVPCPVNPTRDCLSCHMPRVKDAVPHTHFTDHYIRVRR